MKRVQDIINTVGTIKLDAIPTMEDYKMSSSYFEEVARALKIIREYSDGSRIYDPAAVAQDALVLASIHAHLSEAVGYLQGMSSRGESQRKVNKAAYALCIKKERDALLDKGEPVKITERDVDEASRVLSKDAHDAARDAETISRMISAAWYSIGDFVRILNTVAGKHHWETDRVQAQSV